MQVVQSKMFEEVKMAMESTNISNRGKLYEGRTRRARRECMKIYKKEK